MDQRKYVSIVDRTRYYCTRRSHFVTICNCPRVHVAIAIKLKKLTRRVLPGAKVLSHSFYSRRGSTRVAVLARSITTFQLAFGVLGCDVGGGKKENHTPAVIRMKLLRLGLDIQELDAGLADSSRAEHSRVAEVFDPYGPQHAHVLHNP